MKQVFFLGMMLLSILLGCAEQNKEEAAPRPKGYQRIPLPKTNYQPLKENHPFTFEYAQSAKVLPDTVVWAEPHWIYVYYPQWKAYIQLTYKPLNKDRKRLSRLIDDAFTLAGKHQGKASNIQDYQIRTKSGNQATVIELEGEVATSFQFFMTDTTQHYLRGAVYVRTATDNDSLAPIIAQLKKDALHLIETLRWKP